MAAASTFACVSSVLPKGGSRVACPGSAVSARPSSRTKTTLPPARCALVGTPAPATVDGGVGIGRRSAEQLAAPPRLVDELVEEALVWCSQHGLVVGDKNHPVTITPSCSLPSSLNRSIFCPKSNF